MQLLGWSRHDASQNQHPEAPRKVVQLRGLADKQKPREASKARTSFKTITTSIYKMTSVNQRRIQLLHWMVPLPMCSWIVLSCINIVESLTLQKWALRSSDD